MPDLPPIDPTPKPASDRVKAANAAFPMPFDDGQDFADAQRGFLGTVKDGVIAGPGKRPAWDMRGYAFQQSEDAPDSVNPSLWRQARLNGLHGLFEVVPGVYQVRGLDLANMTLIEGATGVILIDTLTTVETAATALALYRTHRG
jgi:alkyl sulfatase BDS1-like metallo-beta-lactamase superfamily hydrolase